MDLSGATDVGLIAELVRRGYSAPATVTREPVCICPRPIRDKDGDWYQDTVPGCPVHRGEAPNLGPRGSARENRAQDRSTVTPPRHDRRAAWSERLAGIRAALDQASTTGAPSIKPEDL